MRSNSSWKHQRKSNHGSQIKKKEKEERKQKKKQFYFTFGSISRITSTRHASHTNTADSSVIVIVLSHVACFFVKKIERDKIMACSLKPLAPVERLELYRSFLSGTYMLTKTMVTPSRWKKKYDKMQKLNLETISLRPQLLWPKPKKTSGWRA